MATLSELVSALRSEETAPLLDAVVSDLDRRSEERIAAQEEWRRLKLLSRKEQKEALEKQGELLRRRAEAHLRGSFGFTSDDLVKFGIQPRKSGPHGPRKPAPAVTAAPAVK